LTIQTNSNFFLCRKIADGTVVVPKLEQQKLIKGNEACHVQLIQGTNQEDQCKMKEFPEDRI